MSLDGVETSHTVGHDEGALSGDHANSARPSGATGPILQVSNGRVVVALAGELNATMTRRLVERLRALPPLGPLVIDLDGVTLRRAELRELDALVADLSGLDLYLSCSRVTGRRLLTHLLSTRAFVVAYPQDASPWMARRAGVPAPARCAQADPDRLRGARGAAGG